MICRHKQWPWFNNDYTQRSQNICVYGDIDFNRGDQEGPNIHVLHFVKNKKEINKLYTVPLDDL